MGYFNQLGAEETTGSPVAVDVLTRLDDRTRQLIEGQAREERRAKWQTIAAVGGAIFAALRLGIIAIPGLRKRRLGSLGGLIPNPARRRRRRRR